MNAIIARHPRHGAHRYVSTLGLIAAVVIAVLLAGTEQAEAHAILARSNPSSGAELASAPALIELWFSEPLEPAASSFEVLASDGRSLAVEAIAVDPTDPHRLSGVSPTLSPGFYTVAYANVSSADGHPWTGAFSFVVLNPDGSRPQGAAVAIDGLGATSSVANVVGRWFSFLGLSLLMGGVALYQPLFVGRRRRPGVWTTYLVVVTRLGVGGVVLAGAGIALIGLEQARSLPDASFTTFLAATRGGTLWAWRALAVEAAAVLVALAVFAARSRRRKGLAVVVGLVPPCVLVAVAAASLQSHANAAPGADWARISHFVHLATSAAWTGGLVVLFVLLAVLHRRRDVTREDARMLLVPFSAFAVASVFVISATGLVRSLGELPTASALWSTEYGRWLIVKLALVGVALLLALRNKWRVEVIADARTTSPRDARAVADVRRLLPFEIVFVVAALLAVAVMGQTPTPRGDLSTQSPPPAHPFSAAETVEGLTSHVQVSPGTLGENDLYIHLYSEDGTDIAGEILRVLVEPRRPEGGGGERIVAQLVSGSVYQAQVVLAQPVTWTIHVEVIRAGHDDAVFDYQAPIAGAAGVVSPGFGSFAPQLGTGHLSAVVVLIAGGGLLVFAGRVRRQAPAYALGTVLVVGSVGVLAWVDDGASTLTNPYPADPQSIARGEALYVRHCEACHGVDGRGDGPEAARLEPRPADLRIHVPAHPEGDTFRFIASGIAGTAMPAWEDELTDDQLWDLVNYLVDEFGPE